MASDDTIRIELLSPTGEPEDATRVRTLTHLVNEVYRDAEKGLWLAGTDRTTAHELDGLVRAGQIAAALTGQQIVGCVRIQQLDERTSEFGMLAASPQRRNLGIGRKLVQFAEEHCRNAGRDLMQLELLVPRGWTHPSKAFLHDWYTRIGYRPIGVGAFEQSHPDLAPRLATPCDFVIYHKNLRPAPGAAGA